MRKLSIVFGVFALLLAVVAPASAQVSVLDLTSIGIYDTTGTYYTSYEYSGENPTLTGVTSASVQVGITIDGESEYVTSGTSGVWTYTPTMLLIGEHGVQITSESESLDFTLTIGESASKGGVVTEGEDVLLDSGIGDYTYLLAFAGIIGLVSAGALVTFKG